jgi:hypothetical protein
MAPVPALYRGQARSLIGRLREAAAAHRRATGGLLDEFQGTPLPERPKRREQHIRKLSRQWGGLSALSRLRGHARQEGIEALHLGEITCRPEQLSRPEWSETELGLIFTLRSILVKPGEPLDDHRWDIATVGLHALARRYERKGEASDSRILYELFDAVSLRWPEHLAERPGSLDLEGWLVERGGIDRTLNARTYLPPPPGLIPFVDRWGRLCASPTGWEEC